MLCFIPAANVLALNSIRGSCSVFIVLIFFHFKVMSQASITVSEQVILNTSNKIIPVLSRSMYSIFFLENS